jgi:hypothetical protein
MNPDDLTHEELCLRVRELLPADVRTYTQSSTHEINGESKTRYSVCLFCGGQVDGISVLFECLSAIDVVNELADFLDALYWTGAPICTNDDCDRLAEPGRDLCAQCHDKAGEAQDARDAEGI